MDRNLSNLTVISNNLSTNKTLMNNAYTYYAVDNVMSVTNSVSPQSSGIGGSITHTYNYDGLNRLISASGNYTGAGSGTNQKMATYALSLTYVNLHNITSKIQDGSARVLASIPST